MLLHGRRRSQQKRQRVLHGPHVQTSAALVCTVQLRMCLRSSAPFAFERPCQGSGVLGVWCDGMRVKAPHLNAGACAASPSSEYSQSSSPASAARNTSRCFSVVTCAGFAMRSVPLLCAGLHCLRTLQLATQRLHKYLATG